MKHEYYNKHLYETNKKDTDGCYYPFMNDDVNYLRDALKDKETSKEDYIIFDQILIFLKHFEEYATTTHLYYYYKGCYMYFTYNNKKYYISFIFIDADIMNFIQEQLITCKCHSFYYNAGELD